MCFLKSDFEKTISDHQKDGLDFFLDLLLEEPFPNRESYELEPNRPDELFLELLLEEPVPSREP